MSGSSIALLLIGGSVVLSPILTMFWPRLFGLIGVVALTAAGIYFAVSGKSAFTETTSAVFICGAFVLAGILAIHRELRRSNADMDRED